MMNRHGNENAATSAEIMIGGIILILNIFADIVLYYVGDVMLAPLVDILASWPMPEVLQESLWELTYISYLPFAFMLIFAMISCIGFFMILARRQVSPFDY
jgi:hypothetical protein